MPAKGNTHGKTHGLTLVPKTIKKRTRRGRSYIDRRSLEGRDALQIQAGLVADQGGIGKFTTARFIAIEELSNLYFLAATIDRSTAKFLRENPHVKKPSALAKLFEYRRPVTAAIAKYLEILGLDKAPADAYADIVSEIRGGSCRRVTSPRRGTTAKARNENSTWLTN